MDYMYLLTRKEVSICLRMGTQKYYLVIYQMVNDFGRILLMKLLNYNPKRVILEKKFGVIISS